MSTLITLPRRLRPVRGTPEYATWLWHFTHALNEAVAHLDAPERRAVYATLLPLYDDISNAPIASQTSAVVQVLRSLGFEVAWASVIDWTAPPIEHSLRSQLDVLFRLRVTHSSPLGGLASAVLAAYQDV